MNYNKVYNLISQHFDIIQNRCTKEEICIICPYSNCDDKTGNLNINPKKELYHCWVCDARGSIGSLFRDFKIEWINEGYAYVEKVHPLLNMIQINEKDNEKDNEINMPKEFVRLYDINKKDKLYNIRNMAIKYLKKNRKLTKKDIEENNLGLMKDSKSLWGAIIIPVYDATSRLIYYFGRYFLRIGERYNNPVRSREDVFWGLNRLNPKLSRVVICEGFFDAIRTKNGLAALSSVLTSSQIFILKNIWPNEIIIGLDAGEYEKTKLMYFALINAGFENKQIKIIKFRKGEKDLGELETEEIDKRIEEAVYFNEYIKDFFESVEDAI